MSTVNPLYTISDVLMELDRIIEDSVSRNDLLGVFAFVYRRTTEKILEGIQNGYFLDGARMEKLDVIFAKRYIDAYWQLRSKTPTTLSWEVAFAARKKDITLLQHLLLSMNAHINFDLGIAAATIATGDHIFQLKEDFMKVNDLLEELTEEMQDRLSKVSRLMVLLDWIGGRKDEVVVNFSIRRARGFAWRVASQLAFLEGPAKDRYIQQVDETTANIGRLIYRPPGKIISTTLSIIRFFEEREVSRIIKQIS